MSDYLKCNSGFSPEEIFPGQPAHPTHELPQQSWGICLNSSGQHGAEKKAHNIIQTFA